MKAASTLCIVLSSIAKSLSLRWKAILHIIVLKRNPTLKGLPVELPVCFIHRQLVSLSSCTVPQKYLCAFSGSHFKLIKNCEYVMW